jgi:adenylylsulfate kinase
VGLGVCGGKSFSLILLVRESNLRFVDQLTQLMSADANLYPIFERLLPRAEKERKLGQRGQVIWLYGLSGSGKSTLAVALEHRLHGEGFATQLLDGDNIRSGLNRGLGFSDADRAENIRRIAEVAKLHAQAGIVTLCSFITPLRSLRELARTIIGPDDLLEVYVHASFATCAARDPKGLYAKAAAGGVGQFTGKDSAFESPAADAAGTLIIDTETYPAESCLTRLHAAVQPRIKL